MARQAQASSYQQAVFTQEQLEKLYEDICKTLWPHRTLVSVVQNALMFRPSHMIYSLVLFTIVHVLFVWYARSGYGLVVTAVNILFLGGILYTLWYASTYSERKHGNKYKQLGTKPPARFTSIERIICKLDQPRESSASFTYEEVCFLFAKRWNWFNLLWLALIHWYNEDPKIFCALLAVLVSGFISLVWYIPGLVLSYCTVMLLLLWPYIEYHQYHYRFCAYLAGTIPPVISRAVRWLTQMKEYAEDDKDINTRVASLDGRFEHDLGSQQMSAAERRRRKMSERMDSFFGSPIQANTDPMQSLLYDPSFSNVDLNMSLLPSANQPCQPSTNDDDDDPTSNYGYYDNQLDDDPTDYGHYDSHDDDNAFPELDFCQQNLSRQTVTQQPSNLTTAVAMSGNPVTSSTPVVDYEATSQQDEFPLPSYDEAMGTSLSTPPMSQDSQYPYNSSKLTHRNKNST